MSLWWMQPDWTEARCCQCGDNIYDGGGDPDWGLCLRCMQDNRRDEKAARDCEDGDAYIEYLCGQGGHELMQISERGDKGCYCGKIRLDVEP